MLKLLLVVGAFYAVIVATLYFGQTRMIYLPDMPGRELTAKPSDVGMEYRDVELRTSDAVDIHGWFVPGAGSKVLLFFHGNAGNISHRLDSIRQFHELGLSVLIVDYRGYGSSGGRPGEAGMYRDAEAAWSHLVDELGFGPDQVVVFGRSLGGSIAAKLASGKRPHALIVESAFTSVPDIASELYPWLPARWLSRMRHATRDYVADVHAPVLVIHSLDDEIIPYHHGEKIFDAAAEPKTLLTIRGSHNDAWIRDDINYINGLREFLGASARSLPKRD